MQTSTLLLLASMAVMKRRLFEGGSLRTLSVMSPMQAGIAGIAVHSWHTAMSLVHHLRSLSALPARLCRPALQAWRSAVGAPLRCRRRSALAVRLCWGPMVRSYGSDLKDAAWFAWGRRWRSSAYAILAWHQIVTHLESFLPRLVYR